MFNSFTNVAILQRLWPVANDIVTSFGVAGTPADLWFRFADLMRHALSRRNSAAVFALPVYRDRTVALDPSSIPVAKAGPISDNLPLTDK
jgi:hypothetical protein